MLCILKVKTFYFSHLDENSVRLCECLAALGALNHQLIEENLGQLLQVFQTVSSDVPSNHQLEVSIWTFICRYSLFVPLHVLISITCEKKTYADIQGTVWTIIVHIDSHDIKKKYSLSGFYFRILYEYYSEDKLIFFCGNWQILFLFLSAVLFVSGDCLLPSSLWRDYTLWCPEFDASVHHQVHGWLVRL